MSAARMAADRCGPLAANGNACSNQPFEINYAMMKRQGTGETRLDEPMHAAGGRRKGRLAFLRRALAASALGAALFIGGFGLFATHVARLATPDDVARADAIIVLTGGQARIDAALGLLQSGKGERLLISGVNPMAD